MRKVVLAEPETVSVRHTSTEAYHGVLLHNSTSRGFVIRLAKNAWEVVFDTRCPGRSPYQAATLAGLIEMVIKSNCQVYEFYDLNDLYRWLAE